MWYYLLSGRPQGPVSLDEIKNQILLGHLNAADRLYREKDTVWRKASEFQEVQALLVDRDKVKNAVNRDDPSSEKEVNAKDRMTADWVLLVRKSDGSGYRQKGPLTKNQIVQLIETGQVSFADYVWKKGLKEWCKIVASPEFQHLVEGKPNAMPPLPDVNAEIHKKVEEDASRLTNPHSTDSQIKIRHIEESLRADSSNKIEESLWKNTTAPVPQPAAGVKVERQIRRKSRSRKLNADSVGSVRRISPIQYYFSMTPIKRIRFALLLLGTLSLGIYLVVYFSSYLDRKNTQLTAVKKSQVVAIDVPKSQVPVAADAPASAAASLPSVDTAIKSEESVPVETSAVVDAKMSPSYIRLTIENEGSQNATLKVQTDGSEEYPIFLRIIAEGGDAIERSSYFKRIKVNTLEDRTFRLDKYKLPFGRLTVLADSEGLNSSLQVNYGTNDAKVLQKVNQFKKKNLMQHNDERYSYIKLSDRMENEIGKLIRAAETASQLQSWRSFYRDWRKGYGQINSKYLKVINNKNRTRYLHSEKWLSLQDLRNKIDRETKKIDKDVSKNKKANLKDLQKQVLELSALKDKMIQASLYE